MCCGINVTRVKPRSRSIPVDANKSNTETIRATDVACGLTPDPRCVRSIGDGSRGATVIVLAAVRGAVRCDDCSNKPERNTGPGSRPALRFRNRCRCPSFSLPLQFQTRGLAVELNELASRFVPPPSADRDRCSPWQSVQEGCARSASAKKRVWPISASIGPADGSPTPCRSC